MAYIILITTPYVCQNQMFDEGTNQVTINLPANVEHQASERQLVRQQLEQNDTADMLPKQVMPVRDYSIDTWNGQAGFDYWNYDESSPNAET